MIRENDPKLKQVDGELFKDSDFEAEAEGEKEKQKPITYKDQVRSDILKKARKGSSDGSEDDENDEGLFKKKTKGETLAEEEARLKREFKVLADDDNSDGDDFLKKKKESSDSELEPDQVPNLKPEVVIVKAQKKVKKELKLETDTDLLKRFYGDESQLDQTDKFLRNYILLQCWKDKKKGG